MKIITWGIYLGLALALRPDTSRAEYSYFYTSSGSSLSGSDIIMKDVRWPYWNSYYYNTWINDNWTSSDGVSGYFYNGLALPSASSPNPVTSRQTLNWSFWPLSSPINISDTITPVWTSPNTFSMPTIAEGTICRAPGLWSGWQTNVWYRMAIRTWQPVAGTAHLGFSGTWMRDGSSGIWYHMATVQLPFAVTGVTGSDGFQENASGGSQPQRTDYRNCYYHKSNTWNAASKFQVYNHAGAVENAGLIENNTAVYYETCENNPSYTGTITNVGQYSPTFTISSQPAAPTFDPILVTNYGASLSGSQLLVQWQMLPTSSPQFAYQVKVYTNASYTGTVVASAYDIAPEVRQKLLDIGNATTPYVQLTIVDIFNQTNMAINVTTTNATLSLASTATGTVDGLNFAYYQSASNYTSDGSTNWSSMPNFAALTPMASGAVSGLDLTPRKRRNGYAFNYTGYLNIASNGLYTFTLNSSAGSKLYVDGQLVVNWDGEHSPSDLSGGIGLQAGLHTLNVQYFCDTQPTSLFSEYFDRLTLSYAGPGFSQTPVPVNAYRRTPGASEPLINLLSPTNNTTIVNVGVPLNATVTPNGATINKVQFYVGDYFWSQDTALPYTASSFFWANPANPVHARLTYNTTNILDSDVNLVTTTNGTLAPWQFNQIFYHNTPNGAAIQGGTYSVIGDGVNLLARQINGDCTLIAHLAGLPTTAAAPDGSTANSGWEAGIILRGNTNMTPGYPWGQTGTAPFTTVLGQVGGGAYYQDESMVNGGGGYTSSNLGGQKWFKIQRAGNVFTSSVSANGITWQPVYTNTLTDFPQTIYAGFFTYAGPSSNPNIPWASFDNVSLTGKLVGPPSVTVNPSTETVYANQGITFNANPTGNAPFFYQWQHNGINLTGATNATLVLTSLQVADSGSYTVQLTNADGGASATASLSVLTASPVVTQILSNNPTGYWHLNETTGPTAYDATGSLDGTGEGGIVFGVPGVTTPPFNGFGTDNLAAQFNGTDADISVPGFNLTTTNFTITGWVRCNGAQVSYSGLMFSRSSGYGTGLMMANNGNNLELRYGWNDDGGDYNFSTHLNLPTNGMWAFIALTIEPNRAIVYLATNSVLQSATNNVTNSGRTFNGNFYFGSDPNGSSRRLNGALDEIAIYNRTLSQQQLGQLLSASGQTTPAVTLTAPISGANFGAPATINLAANVSTNGHTINNIQFYSGTNLLGTADGSGAYLWANVAAGTYTLFAQVTYDGSSMMSSMPVIVSVNPVPLVPATPTVTALAANLAIISWPPAAYASSYQLFRNGQMITTLTGTNYQDFGLAANTSYCYAVVASNNYGNSDSSASSCITTPATGTALQWDAGGSTAGAQDGSANWSSTVNTWWNGSATVAWQNSALAIIGSGTMTNCVATITSTLTLGGIIFNANNGGGYTLAGTVAASIPQATTIEADDASSTISVTLQGAGSLIKTGSGTLTLSGSSANTFTGGLTVNAGTIIAGKPNGTAYGACGNGNVVVNSGGILTANGDNSLVGQTVSSAKSIRINAGGIVNNTATSSGHLNAIVLNGGTLSATAANSSYGNWNLDNGVSTPGNGSTSTISGGNVTLSQSGGSVFNVGANDSVIVSSILDHTANGADNGLIKTGSGTLVLSSVNTYTSKTTVNAGKLQVDGSIRTNTVTIANTATLAGAGIVSGAVTVASGGTLAPGDNTIGTLTISNTLSLAGNTVMELSKTNTVLTNDLVKRVTTLTYGGGLVVTNLGSTALTAGDTFTL
ncbi:MAG TPA: LamG-like jellyroll fold domain-containing protein, partial [Verrucomicrobiae bacterium]